MTGPTRDLDVHLLEFDALRAPLPGASAADARAAARLLAEQPARASADAWCARCARQRTRRLLADWPRSSTASPSCAAGDRPARRAADRARSRASASPRVYRHMVKAGSAIDDASPPEALHDLRKKGKELRYLLEFFAQPLSRAGASSRWCETLKALQDTLGRFQDREVQAQLLRALRRRGRRARRRRRGADGDGSCSSSALDGDQAAARAEFAERFAAFAAEPQRALREGDVRVSRVLATYNIKGGVGKTSAAVNLAYLAARDGARTLLWDLDPQGASTYLFRVKPKVKGGGAQARARQERRRARRSRAPTTSGSTCCRPTSPTATWTSPSTRRSARRGAWRGCSRRSPTSTTTSSSTARRASRSCPRASSRPPTRCSCR